MILFLTGCIFDQYKYLIFFSGSTPTLQEMKEEKESVNKSKQSDASPSSIGAGDAENVEFIGNKNILVPS